MKSKVFINQVDIKIVSVSKYVHETEFERIQGKVNIFIIIVIGI